jgi:hypothetical protein
MDGIPSKEAYELEVPWPPGDRMRQEGAGPAGCEFHFSLINQRMRACKLPVLMRHM